MTRKKLYDIAIHSPLTDEKRAEINRLIELNAASLKLPTQVTSQWDEANPQLLHINTPPVVWEVFFYEERVEVFATGPGWVKLLLTRKRQEEIHEQLEKVLRTTGFLNEDQPV